MQTQEALHVSFVRRNQSHLAPPMLGLHCTHFLRHQCPSTPHHLFPIYPSTVHGSRILGGRGFTVPKRPNPATAHHTITTARRPDNIRSSALVRGQSTQFMANPCRWPQRWSPETRLHFHHFRGIFYLNSNHNQYQ